VSILLPCELALLAALVVHQFLTRRLHRSLGLLAAGTIAAAFVGLFWPWETNAAVMRSLTRDKIGNEKIKATVDGASLYTIKHEKSALMTVPVRLEGIPAGALMFAQAQATWSLNHQVVWKRGGYGINGFGPAAPGSAQLQLAKAEENKAETTIARSGGLSFSVSPLLAERMTREPAAFHADIDVRLYDGYVVADLTLREQSQRTRDGSVLVRDIQPVRMTPELHRELNLSNRTPVGSDVLLIHLIHRFGDLPGHLKTLTRAWVHPHNDIVLSQRGTSVVIPGEISLAGFNLLNGVGVLSETVVFKLPSSSVDLTDFQLKIYGYENDRTVICPVDADPLVVRAAEANSPKS
jgi:hypothetical protein